MNGVFYLTYHEISNSYAILSFNFYDEKFDEIINRPSSKNNISFFIYKWKDSLAIVEWEYEYHTFWVKRDDKSTAIQNYSFKLKVNTIGDHFYFFFYEFGDFSSYFKGSWRNGFLFSKFPKLRTGEVGGMDFFSQNILNFALVIFVWETSYELTPSMILIMWKVWFQCILCYLSFRLPICKLLNYSYFLFSYVVERNVIVV